MVVMASRRRRRWWIASLTLALVVGAGVVAYRQACSSDPVSGDEALADFRRSGGRVGPSGPRPGVYTYAATGSERGGTGPISITRDVPSQARLVVTPDGAGWYAELSYSKQHIEGARYEQTSDGIVITSRRTKVTFAGVGRDDRRSLEPPSRFLPAGASAGTRWSESYRTGDIAVAVTTRIERTEALDVGGSAVATMLIISDATTTGAHPGTRRERLWWSPDLALPVRWDVDMEIRGTFGFSADTSLTLEAIEPAV